MSEASLHENIVNSLKAATWERAKGELRALIALSGSTHTDTRGEDGRHEFEVIEELVNDFIKQIEDEELHL